MRSETPHRAPVVRVCAALVAGAALLLLAGCGSQTEAPPSASDPTSPATSASTGPTPSASASSPPRIPAGTPPCGAVWEAGERLPAAYAGCVADGAFVKPHKVGCSSGQSYVLYGKRWWAVRGGTIKVAKRDWAHSAEYRHDMAACRG